MLRYALLACLALLLAACGQSEERKPHRQDDSSPLLWEIARADGTVEGWLLGTIHALPDDALWRTASIDDVIADADLLAVEIDTLEDSAEIAHAFAPLAFSSGQPPLLARVPPEKRDQLAALVSETTYGLDDFQRIESWGAALILAQAVESGAKSENGVDRALMRDFRARRIVELEGATRQFAAFDGLSESAQRAMLAAIVEEAQMDSEARNRPVELYLAGDAEGLDRLTAEGMLANPEIRTALLTRRNRDWVTRIDELLGEEPRPLVAVGAAHMVGEDGLVALLEGEGYRVSRIR